MVTEGRPAASFILDAGYRHAERLMPAVSDLMSATGRRPRDMDLVAVTAGPGSFTGLRVGVTTARVLAWTLGARLVAVPTLDALAYGARLHRGVVCAAIDARREAAFAACYRWDLPPGPGDVGRCMTTSPRRVDLACLVADLKEQAGPVLLVGDVTSRYAGMLGQLGMDHGKLGTADQAWIRPELVALIGLALGGQDRDTDPHDLAPHYLRESGAERGRRA